MKVPRPFLVYGLALVLLANWFGAVRAGAQSAAAPSRTQKIENRFLFIFDTAATMKKRVPQVQVQVDSLLASRLADHLQDGDTIGVWTFDRQLRMGEMPLQRWTAQNSTLVADNIKSFVETQNYKNDTDLTALQPY